MSPGFIPQEEIGQGPADAMDRLWDACFGCIFRAVVVPGESAVNRARKRRSIVIGAVFLALSITTPLLLLSRNGVYIYSIIGMAFMVIPSMYQIGYIAVTKAAPSLLLEAVSYCYVVAMLFHDWSSRRIGGQPVWPFAILILDMCLVNQLPLRVTRNAVIIICIWLIAVQVMAVLGDWGPGVTDTPRICDCENPPCAIGAFVGSSYAVLDLGVLLVDFYLTRNFASQVVKEKSAMQNTINAVQCIASHLADYDLDAVSKLLKEDDVSGTPLPSEIRSALRSLHQNLTVYKPYLPNALFEQDSDSGERKKTPENHSTPRAPPRSSSPRVLVPAPGVESREATILFTDIRASTSIWEAAPEAMKRAMRTHNSAIRAALDRWYGYEVKTVGDSFMAAFARTASGLNFALTVHESLIAATWPSALLALPICSRKKNIWGGLTVRIGMNTGPVSAETNALTKRVDYFGHTVNVAARLEGVCLPGAVSLPADLWEVVQDHCMAVGGQPEEVTLKGVREKFAICCVWPVSLSRRRFDPLVNWEDPHSGSFDMDTLNTVVRFQPLVLNRMSRAHATTGIVLQHQRSDDSNMAQSLSNGLEELTNALERSKGTLVTILGSFSAVGWNTRRGLQAHAESSVQFVRLLQRCDAEYSVGLCSGRVQHGYVGSRLQRFVTTVGTSVSIAWSLCIATHHNNITCLYTTLVEVEDADDTDSDFEPLHLDTALRRQLAPATIIVENIPTPVYELKQGGAFLMTSVTHDGESFM